MVSIGIVIAAGVIGYIIYRLVSDGSPPSSGEIKNGPGLRPPR